MSGFLVACAGRKCNPLSWQGQSPKNRPEGDLPLKNLAGRPRRICQPGPPDSLRGTPNCKRYHRPQTRKCTFSGEQGPRGPQPQTLLEAPPTPKTTNGRGCWVIIFFSVFGTFPHCSDETLGRGRTCKWSAALSEVWFRD